MPGKSVNVIEPDLGFIRQIIDNGGDTLKKCFQCGNCTAVCDVTQDEGPFPRKEMIWAQWGLKERLLADPDIWQCHQCNDCTTHCPRGAKPGDVFSAIRNISFAHYGAFGLGKYFASPKYLPFLFLIPVALIALAIGVASKSGFVSMKPVVFSNMMPVPAIDAVFLPAVIFAFVAALAGVGKFWKNMKSNSGAEGPSPGAIIPAFLKVVMGVLTHKKMRKCVTNAPRVRSHLALMYGFIALIATTSAVALMYWINKLGIAEVAVTPLALTHPVKILGNLGALMTFTGITLMLARRFGPESEKAGGLGYYDRFFLIVTFWTVATGILSEIFRLMDTASLAFFIYYVHLVFVFTLIVYFPFSKFAHLLYRFAAMTFAGAMEKGK